MFTLKLYRSNGSPTPHGRTVIIECAGFWVDECERGVKHVQTFKGSVGVMDEDGGFDAYVGGDHTPQWMTEGPDVPPSAITPDNYYSWGVIENALGKTTEMIR